MMNSSITLPIWNPYQKGYLESPWEQLKVLREQNPIHRSISGQWMFFRYDDVKFFLTHPGFKTFKLSETIASKSRFVNAGDDLTDLAALSSKWLLFLDPPDHKEIRSLLSKAWNSYNLEQHIKEIVNDTLEGLTEKQEIETVKDFAGAIPSNVICRVLGLPSADAKRLREWAYYFVRVLEPFETLYQLQLYNRKAKEFYEYLSEVLDTKKRHPDDSLISEIIINNEELPVPFGKDDLISALCVLFFAGIETSVNLFAQSVLLLLKNPLQKSFVQENGILPPSAIDELIRFITPTQYTKRLVAEDAEFSGIEFKKGEILMGSLASANHDANVFENPEELNLTREKNPHLSFGYGLHYCLGARLAREEISISIPAFFRRFPKAALHPQRAHEWDNMVLNRALKSLPVILHS